MIALQVEMSSDQEAESLSHDAGFAGLVRRIKIGDESATRDFRSTFKAGIEFLLRRKLSKIDVSAEVTTVTEATLGAIQTSRPSESLNLPGLIVSIIHTQFPSSFPVIHFSSLDSSAVKGAQSVLAQLSPVEQSILEQYYALGADEDTIKIRLSASSQTIRETLAKARSMFFHRTHSAGL